MWVSPGVSPGGSPGGSPCGSSGVSPGGSPGVSLRTTLKTTAKPTMTAAALLRLEPVAFLFRCLTVHATAARASHVVTAKEQGVDSGSILGRPCVDSGSILGRILGDS